MDEIWTRGSAELKSGLLFFKSSVLPKATHTSEIWSNKEVISKRLDAVQEENLRRILKITYTDHQTE